MQLFRKLAILALLSLPVTLFAEGMIDINTADKEALMTLSGVGAAFAERIIDYREEHGGFMSVQELTDIRGIGPALIEKNKDVLTVSSAPE